MIIRTALAATVAATAFLHLQMPASADDNTVVRDHRTKVVVRDHRTKVVVRDHRSDNKVRDHRTGTTVRDHRTDVVVRDHRDPRKTEVVVVTREKLSCATGYQRLLRTGYRSISVIDCTGIKYSYNGVMDQKIFRADMNAYTGNIEVTLLGFAH